MATFPLLKFILASCITSYCLSAYAQSFTFAAVGDMPYGSSAKMERLIEQLNAEDLAFTIHVGDIKSGATECSDETYLRVRDLFNRFAQALIYTPGDNEWTDCHRPSNGSRDPLERLDKLRRLFFTDARSLGRQPLTLQSQSSVKGFESFVENRLWHHQKVTFGTLHLVGSNNNLQPEAAAGEYFRRDQANQKWLALIFSEARAMQSAAVVLAMQADTWLGGGPFAGSGFLSWLDALETEAKAWGKPVLLIQGDSHEFKLDQPFVGKDRKRIDNVTRLVVHGDQHVHATLVDVHPYRPNQPFSFHILLNDRQ